jgi:uncharacterized membrane protein YeaQ/YmgE (transglycosylase-associated protein family)
VGIVGWIILGAFAGTIAKALLPGDDPGGFILTPVIGIVGALIGGFLARLFGLGHPVDHFFDISTWVTAIAGSVVLLVAYRIVTGGKRHAF